MNEIELPDYPWTYPESSDSERDRRWRSIRKLMAERGIECLLIPGSDGHILHDALNMLYVSNYVTYFGRSFAVFPLEGEPFLSLGYPEGGNPEQRGLVARYHSWIKNISASQGQGEEVGGYLKRLGLEKSKIGIVDPMLIPAPIYEKIRNKLPELKFENATSIITGLRAVLSDEEQAMLQKAAELCDRSYEAATEVARPGVREYEVWGEILKAVVGNGGYHPSFCLVTSARKPMFPRSPSSHRTLERGDTILGEVNGIWGGYIAQIMWAFSLGPPDKDIIPLSNFCIQLYDQTCTDFNEGKTYREVKDSLDKRIRQAGFVPMTPQVHLNLAADSERALPGHNFEIHPCVATEDYKLGMKIGDHVMIDRTLVKSRD